MKSTHILATALLSLSCAAAFAQPTTMTTDANTLAARDAANQSAGDNYPVVPFQSTKTRAAVMAELQQAQQKGLIANNDSYPIMSSTPSANTRAQVKSDIHALNTSLYSGA